MISVIVESGLEHTGCSTCCTQQEEKGLFDPAIVVRMITQLSADDYDVLAELAHQNMSTPMIAQAMIEFCIGGLKDGTLEKELFV